MNCARSYCVHFCCNISLGDHSPRFVPNSNIGTESFCVSMHLCLKHEAAHDDNTGKNTAVIAECVCATRFYSFTLSRALRLVEPEGIEKRETRVAGVGLTHRDLQECLGAVFNFLCTGMATNRIQEEDEYNSGLFLTIVYI